MSDTTNDTSAIDDKKDENSTGDSKNFASNIVSFIKSIVVVFIVILLYFSASGLILFVCKLAQSNILPTEANCYPYTDDNPTIQPIKTNIFTTFTEPEMSMKMEFPYNDYNSSNKILDMFRNYKNKPNSHFLANYFISIIEQLMLFNYSGINSIMNFMNSTIPEAAIVGLGPLIMGFLYIFGILINTIYFVYLWFSNMYWFFKTNNNDSADEKPKWEDVYITSPFNWFNGVGLVILFTIIFIFCFVLISPISLLFYHKTLITTILYKALMNGKQITSSTIIIETLKYYKLIVVTIFSIFVILLAFSNLGVVPGIFSIITLGLIYWGILAIDLFKPINETNLTPVVGYNQAIKKCSFAKSKKEKQGFLYNLFLGQSGGNITKELKKINKKLSTN
jgi:hypothetical protein